jgi:hypothetical protein
MTDASVLDVGTQCFYRKRDGTVATVVVLKVHHDEQPPYYTIGIDATECEKQTEREKLRPCSQGPWPGLKHTHATHARGMIVTGTMSGQFMSGKTIPNVPGLLHPRAPDTYVFAVHEGGHTKMAAFKIPGPTATPMFMEGRAHVGKLLPIDYGAIGDTWDSAQDRNKPYEGYKVTGIVCRPSPQGLKNSELIIVRAWYGGPHNHSGQVHHGSSLAHGWLWQTGDRKGKDVTAILRSSVRNGELNFNSERRGCNDLFGFGHEWPCWKILVVQYKYGESGQVQTWFSESVGFEPYHCFLPASPPAAAEAKTVKMTFKEGDVIQASDDGLSASNIVEAWYGARLLATDTSHGQENTRSAQGKVVTEQARGLLAKGQLKAINELFGDPAPFKLKVLELKITPKPATAAPLSDEKIDRMLKEREQARSTSDFKTADKIRETLEKNGVHLNDKEKKWQTADGRSGPIGPVNNLIIVRAWYGGPHNHSGQVHHGSSLAHGWLWQTGDRKGKDVTAILRSSVRNGELNFNSERRGCNDLFSFGHEWRCHKILVVQYKYGESGQVQTWFSESVGSEPYHCFLPASPPPPPGLKLEGGSLPGEAAKYPGTYRLVVGKLVNGRPAYQHTSDATLWITFAGDRWMGQSESLLGQKLGFLDLADPAAASPDASTMTWKANAGGAAAWAEAPQLKCIAWTPPPPPPPGLKLEGGSLPGEAAKYPGTYRLVVGKLVNGRPAYQHTSDATLWITFAGDRWMGQSESLLGQKLGFLDLMDPAAASPDVSTMTWKAWNGSAWVEQPQLKCTAWTPLLSAAEKAADAKAAAEKVAADKAAADKAAANKAAADKVRVEEKAHRALEEDGFALRPMLMSDASVLRSLEALLQTEHPDWLGKGKDVCKKYGPYDSLKLACAWKVDHPRNLDKYTAGVKRVQEEMDLLKRKGKDVDKVPGLPVRTSGAAKGFTMKAGANEAILLHGTSPERLLELLSTGLNERYSGTNAGTAFGDGIYLAEDVGKTDQYVGADSAYDPSNDLHKRLYGRTVRHPGDVFYVLVVRAALGYPVRTQQVGPKATSMENLTPIFPKSFRELLPVQGVTPPIVHHSLIAELGPAIARYREFVLFHSEYVHIDYVIAYHRCNGGQKLSTATDNP